jgi:hypothetical protein
VVPVPSCQAYWCQVTDEQAQAHARLYGTVLSAEQRTVEATGRQFTAVRVCTAGFDVDMCLPPTQAPMAGNVVGGTVFLTASLRFTASAQPARRFR